MNSIALNFFVELWQRLKTKSPTFFRVLQLVAALLTIAGYIPSVLQRWFNVEVPGHIITMCEDISKYAAGFLVAAALPVNSEQVAITTEGEILKKTDDKKLPFTAQKEIKEAVKEGGLLETGKPIPVVQTNPNATNEDI